MLNSFARFTALVSVIGLNAGLARAASFANSTPITITDNANSSAYPSTIVVGVSVPITNIVLGLNGLSHNRLSDLTVLLVSPTGKKIQLLAGASGFTVGPLPISFSDAGRAFDGGQLAKVGYRPTAVPSTVAMPSPAPGLPYQTSFASLIGDDIQGTWSLYVRDNVTGEAGSIDGGWSLSFNVSGLSKATSEFTYQGSLAGPSGPLSGVHDIKLDFWKSPISLLPADTVGTATAFAVPVENGLFTARFAPPENVFTDGNALWAEISVKAPGDANFTTLSPRQQLTASPFASYALFADQAEFAGQAGSVSWSNIIGIPNSVLNPFIPWQAGAANSITNTNTGNVGIGTAATTSKLAVGGVIESTGAGFKFSDGTTLSTAPVSPIVASGVAAIDFASIAAGAEGTAGVSLGGALAQLTDVVVISPQTDLPADFSIEYARVFNSTNIRFRVRNNGTSAVDPSPINFNWRVIR